MLNNPELWKWVQLLYLLSQIALPVIAVLAGLIALKQYRSSRIFDTVQYLEDWNIRDARRLIYKELIEKKAGNLWWEHMENDELGKAAAGVCARYNLVGAVTEDDRQVRKFLTRAWAHNIGGMFNALEDYIDHREIRARNAFQYYRKLNQEAKQHLEQKR